jgi:hypothetical protein
VASPSGSMRIESHFMQRWKCEAAGLAEREAVRREGADSTRLRQIACFIMPKSSPSTVEVTGFNPNLNAVPTQSAPHSPVPVQIRHKRYLPTGYPPFIPFWSGAGKCSTQNRSLPFAFDWCSLVPRSHKPNANYNILKRNLPIPFNTST